MLVAVADRADLRGCGGAARRPGAGGGGVDRVAAVLAGLRAAAGVAADEGVPHRSRSATGTSSSRGSSSRSGPPTWSASWAGSRSGRPRRRPVAWSWTTGPGPARPSRSATVPPDVVLAIDRSVRRAPRHRPGAGRRCTTSTPRSPCSRSTSGCSTRSASSATSTGRSSTLGPMLGGVERPHRGAGAVAAERCGVHGDRLAAFQAGSSSRGWPWPAYRRRLVGRGCRRRGARSRHGRRAHRTGRPGRPVGPRGAQRGPAPPAALAAYSAGAWRRRRPAGPAYASHPSRR